MKRACRGGASTKKPRGKLSVLTESGKPCRSNRMRPKSVPHTPRRPKKYTPLGSESDRNQLKRSPFNGVGLLASAWRIGLATFSERFRWLDVSGASKPSDLLRWTNLAPLRRGSVRRVGLPGWYNKFPIRDHTMVLVAYRHGLRASELGDLQWHQVELTTGRLYVRRAKNGSPSVQSGRRDRALRRLQREQAASPHVFSSERGGPMTPKAFHALFARIGSRAKMPFPVHSHMLRHGCRFALARALEAWLGTVTYCPRTPG